MILVLERVSSEVAQMPGDRQNPEGQVSITFKDGYNTFPIIIPKLQALRLGMQIVAAASGDEVEGTATTAPASVSLDEFPPPAEPVYGSDGAELDADDEPDAATWPTPEGPE